MLKTLCYVTPPKQQSLKFPNRRSTPAEANFDPKMMNLVAICLVVSSLAAAGVWCPSPSPGKESNKEAVIVMKEGHGVVVVECDDQGRHNTKVSISLEHDRYGIPKSASSASDIEGKISSAAADALNNAKDTIQGASSVLLNHGQGSKPYDRVPESLYAMHMGNASTRLPVHLRKLRTVSPGVPARCRHMSQRDGIRDRARVY